MMQASLAALVVLLAGQVDGGRYGAPPETPATQPDPAARSQFSYEDGGIPEAAAAPDNPFPVGGETPQPSLPADTQSPVTPGVGGGYPSGAAAPVTPTTELGFAGAANAAVAKPKDLISELMQPPAAGSELQGRPISLSDAVAVASSRSAQTQLAEAYWDLSADVADYYLTLHEAAELQSLAATVAAPADAWRAAEQQHQLRSSAALRTAQAAQTRLHGLMGAAETTPLPLPSDLPHAGRYDSQYENIFGDAENRVARQLNELLPVEYSKITALATAVTEANDWLSLVSARRTDATGEGLLRAHDLLSLRRREFVDAVRHYNHHIAEYSELATPGRVETQRLVAMLIKTSASSDQPWRDPDVQQASAAEPELADDSFPGARAAAPLSGVPSTYATPGAPNDLAAQQGFGASDSADPQVRRRPVIDLLRNREHSILRKPFQRLRGDRR